MELFPEHSSKKIKPCAWMANVPDDRFLNEMTIPGTHDSGTNNLVASVIEIYGRTQCGYIGDQLRNGVRLFDLRVAYEPSVTGNLTLAHACFFCRNADNKFISYSEEIIGDIEKFLAVYPSETVLIAPGYEDNGKDNYGEHMMAWWNSVKDKKTADGQKDLYYYENRVPRLGEVRGRIVIVRRKCFAYGKDDWKQMCNNIGIHIHEFDSSDFIDDNFTVENHYDAKPDEKKEALNKYYDACHEKKIEYTTEGDKTKNKIKICFTSSNAPPGYGPKGIADVVNKFMKYKRYDKGKCYGWILMDFAQSYDQCTDFYYMPPFYFYMSNVFKDEEPQSYISDLWVACVGRSNSSQRDREEAFDLILKNQMHIEGNDLESGKSKKFILMGYLYSGFKNEAITGIAATTSRTLPTFNGWKWYPVRGNDQPEGQDLNRGICTKTDVFLFYTKDPAAGAPITEIKITSEEEAKSYGAWRDEGWDSACWNYSEPLTADLKKNTGYDYVYCLFKRVDGSFRIPKGGKPAAETKSVTSNENKKEGEEANPEEPKVDVVTSQVKIYHEDTPKTGPEYTADVREDKCYCCCCS
ncbi:MAG: hypothetical protein MJ252_09470 [archaeon]|nr:hypothetical protein [archaeon]